MDWQGLLKWSLAQQDGTVTKDIKPMDEETKKWLQEAIEHYSFDEVRRMIEIINEIMKPELITKEDEENRLNLVDELEELVTGLDRAGDFCAIGGMAPLIQYMLHAKYPAVQKSALRLFAASNQNNFDVQEYCAQNGAFDLLSLIQQNQADLTVLEQLVSSISSLVRGQSLENKRQFLRKQGIEIIFQALVTNGKSDRMKEKSLNLFHDLLLYDEELHKTLHCVDKFQNPQKKQKQAKVKGLLKDDKVQDVNNELEENKVFQHMVKTKLSEVGFVKQQFMQFILSDLSDRQLDTRVAYLSCIAIMLPYKLVSQKKELFSLIKVHQEAISKLNDQNKGFNQQEVEICQLISKSF